MQVGFAVHEASLRQQSPRHHANATVSKNPRRVPFCTPLPARSFCKRPDATQWYHRSSKSASPSSKLYRCLVRTISLYTPSGTSTDTVLTRAPPRLCDFCTFQPPETTPPGSITWDVVTSKETALQGGGLFPSWNCKVVFMSGGGVGEMHPRRQRN